MTIARCPGCQTRLQIPEGRPAARCPNCAGVVRVTDFPEKAKPKPSPPPQGEGEEPEEIEEIQEIQEKEMRSRPRKSREEEDRPSRRSNEDEEGPPRARRRRPRVDEEEEDDDERPRRKKPSRRQAQGDGPWPLALGGAVGFVAFGFLCGLMIGGFQGLPPGEDGPVGKLFGLGLGFLVSLILMPLGVVSVKNRRAHGRWGIAVEGTMGIILGFIQALFGGLACGFTLYGLIFTVINGR